MDAVKTLLDAGKVEEAIGLLEQMKVASPCDDTVRYELGNVYWKKQDWKHCLDNQRLFGGSRPCLGRQHHIRLAQDRYKQ